MYKLRVTIAWKQVLNVKMLSVAVVECNGNLTLRIVIACRLSYIRSVIAAEGVLAGSGTAIYSLGYLELVNASIHILISKHICQ